MSTLTLQQQWSSHVHISKASVAILVLKGILEKKKKKADHVLNNMS